MNLADVIRRNLKAYARGSIYTTMPAVVLNTDNLQSEQSVDVLPLISRKFEDDTSLESPILENVPVVFPSGGGGVLTFPLVRGDTVLLVFSMRSIDEWLAGDGSPTTPQNSRSHSISDAIVIPGLNTYSSHLNPNMEDVELKFNEEMFLQLKKSGEISLHNTATSTSVKLTTVGDVRLTTAAGSVTLTASGDLEHFSGATIYANGDIESPTQIRAPSIVVDGKELKDHKHGGVQTGGGLTGVNI